MFGWEKGAGKHISFFSFRARAHWSDRSHVQKPPPPKKNGVDCRSVGRTPKPSKQPIRPTRAKIQRRPILFSRKKGEWRGDRIPLTTRRLRPPSLPLVVGVGGVVNRKGRGGGRSASKSHFRKKEERERDSIPYSTKQYGEDNMGKYGPSWTFFPPTPAVKISS